MMEGIKVDMTNDINAYFFNEDGTLKPGVAAFAKRVKEHGIDVELLGEDEINKLLECFVIAARNDN